MSSLAQFTALYGTALVIVVCYGLYMLRDVPSCFDEEYFEEQEG